MTHGPDDRRSDPGQGAPPGSRRRASRLDPIARRRIGQSLRTLYAGILVQPLPARFEALLDDLAARAGTPDAQPSEPEEPQR
ncbi:NepR family anti-sigma factor [Methylobacterium oxalidis]|uniref:NepR family anti-sigma factor n=1 Tax=Methylobacterium oxalidis TaxID=944322 RepID=UPI0033156193